MALLACVVDESKCKHVHGALERAKKLGDLRGGGNVA